FSVDSKDNTKPAGDGNGSPQFYYMKENSVKNGTTTPVFSDGIWVDFWPLEADSPCQDLKGKINPTSGASNISGSYPGKSFARTIVARHGCNPYNGNAWVNASDRPSAGINVGFFDGHAEFSKLRNLWSYNWH